MANEESVALHVRMGDFEKFDSILPLSYNKNATEYMNKKLKSPHYYVFSNNIEYAKENLKINGKVAFVEWNTHDYEDLYLMRKAKHFIMANSTFSWWGAFLSENKQKIVLVPEEWKGIYKNEQKNMIDESFIQIPIK